MIALGGREILLRCSLAQKRERWFERWRLCGRAQESGDDGEWCESELVGPPSLVRSSGMITLVSRAMTYST